MAIDGLSFDLPSIIPATIGIVIVILVIYSIEVQKVNSFMVKERYFELLNYYNLITTKCTMSKNLNSCINSIVYYDPSNKGKIYYQVYEPGSKIHYPSAIQVCITFNITVETSSFSRTKKEVLLCEVL